MGWRIVKEPVTGKYAVFSTIIDNFVLYHATKLEVIDFYFESNRYQEITYLKRVFEGLDGDGWSGQMNDSFEEALKEVERIHGKDEENVVRFKDESYWVKAKQEIDELEKAESAEEIRFLKVFQYSEMKENLENLNISRNEKKVMEFLLQRIDRNIPMTLKQIMKACEKYYIQHPNPENVPVEWDEKYVAWCLLKLVESKMVVILRRELLI